MKPIVELWTPVLLNGGIFKDNYLVSNMGRVKYKRVYKNGSYKYVLLHVINGTRPYVKMHGGGKNYHKSVAKLVLSSFHYRKGCECANITYLDGDRSNCELSNLKYAVDKAVYEAIQQKEANKPKRTKFILKSCSNCAKNPCFDGMSSLSTDFGAVGCRKYLPREDIQ